MPRIHPGRSCDLADCDGLHHAKGLCFRHYKRSLYRRDPGTERARSRDYYHRNREKIRGQKRIIERKKARERRQKILEKFGRECARCGYAKDWRALEIDHINGGGVQHIATFPNQQRYYDWLLEHGPPEDFQTLCANCNKIKRAEAFEEALL